MKRLLAAFCCVFTVCIVVVSSIVPAFAEEKYTAALKGELYSRLDGESGFGYVTNMVFDSSQNAYSAYLPELDYESPYTVRIPFETPIQFNAGSYYTLTYHFMFGYIRGNTPVSPAVDYTFGLALDGVSKVTVVQSETSSSWINLVQDVTFYCSSSFTADYVYITLEPFPDGDVPYMYAYDLSYTVLAPTEYENKVITGAITNQTTQIQNQIDQSTQDILHGSGLTGPVKPDVEDEKDAIDDIGSKEDEIEDLLGGYDNVTEDLEDIMDAELDADIVDALQGIQGVFTRLVDTLQLSSLITFLLVLGLGLYIIGRRTS